MTDDRLDKVIGTLLQVGVLAAATVVIIGGIWLLAGVGRGAPAYKQFRGEPQEFRSAGGVITSITHPRPEIVIQFGLLILIATPVARVLFSLAAFALQRDWTYVAITLIVLLVLAYSLGAPHG
jgi:uncharacterized membrane protein